MADKSYQDMTREERLKQDIEAGKTDAKRREEERRKQEQEAGRREAERDAEVRAKHDRAKTPGLKLNVNKDFGPHR